MKFSCCPEGSHIYLNDNYISKGIIKNILSKQVYEIGDNEKVIILISDIFGFSGGRIRFIADYISNIGYTVILPDFFNNNPWPKEKPFNDGLKEWIIKQGFETKIIFIENLITELIKKGKTKFGFISFCWGSWLGWKFISLKNKIIIDFCVNLHPSFGIEEMFNRDIMEIVKNIKCPQFIACANNDPDNIKDNGEIIKMLINNIGKENIEIQLYNDMLHGWSVRGDLKNELIFRDNIKVWEEVKQFLIKFFG